MATPKQAVLLIHGIGNQQPMRTLRSFVKAVWTDDPGIHHEFAGSNIWSKPDHVSKSFELRRLTTPTNAGGLRTDFFELYWAHLMHGTGYGHLVGWAWSLLFRSPRTVPPGLKPAYFTVWALLLVMLGVWLFYAASTAAGGAAPEDPANPSRPLFPVLWTVASAVVTVVVFPAIGFVMKEIVGDAARYLRPSAQNIQRRNEIRTEGVALLKALHDRGYDRILVIGHSLGSVIGYDILSHTFRDYNVPSQATEAKAEASQRLETMAQRISEGKPYPVEEVQKAQRAYFEELKSIGGRWKVTDFITLGSPLAHSEILLAADAADLGEKVDSREFPRCLPALEQKLRTKNAANRRFTFEAKKLTNGHHVPIPHHAAVFALTRWTNLYFPARAIVRGDLIGGPITPVFGECIRNVPVATTRRRGFLTHRFYWLSSPWKAGRGDRRRETVAALREALDLVDQRARA